MGYLIRLYRDLLRKRLNSRNRDRLVNKDITILSSNCTGGVLAHDLGLQFLSPTINLYIRPKEFVKFLSDLERYLSYDLQEVDAGEEYPVAELGGGNYAVWIALSRL